VSLGRNPLSEITYFNRSVPRHLLQSLPSTLGQFYLSNSSALSAVPCDGEGGIVSSRVAFKRIDEHLERDATTHEVRGQGFQGDTLLFLSPAFLSIFAIGTDVSTDTNSQISSNFISSRLSRVPVCSLA
jgi:hypothetical protein